MNGPVESVVDVEHVDTPFAKTLTEVDRRNVVPLSDGDLGPCKGFNVG
jgi:hypothetical protein